MIRVIGRGGTTITIDREANYWIRGRWSRTTNRKLQRESVERKEKRRQQKKAGEWSEGKDVGVVKWWKMKYGKEWNKRRNEIRGWERNYLQYYNTNVLCWSGFYYSQCLSLIYDYDFSHVNAHLKFDQASQSVDYLF